MKIEARISAIELTPLVANTQVVLAIYNPTDEELATLRAAMGARDSVFLCTEESE